ENELRCGFVVVLGVGEDLTVLPPELGELTQQPVNIETTIGEHEGARVSEHVDFDAGGQHPGDDLTVDRVGDLGRVTRRDQTEVTNIGKTVVVGLESEQSTGQNRLDDATDARFGKLRSQRVQMSGTSHDKPLLSLLHMLHSDRLQGRNPDLLN